MGAVCFCVRYYLYGIYWLFMALCLWV